MCDPELIAAILHLHSCPRIVVGNPYCHREGQSPVAISSISLEEVGYADDKKNKDKKDEIHDQDSNKDHSRARGEEEK